jgi:leucine-rich repeat-containing G protein-coupled receptor 4
LNILYVPYSGTGDAANVTGNAENEEHSQIIIHCTPSTGNAQPVLS